MVLRTGRRVLAVAALVPFLTAATAFTPSSYPPTRTVAVADTYFGTVVDDPYRWLENGSDPEVKAWAAAQTRVARTFIDAAPSFAGYKQRVAQLSRTSTRRFRLVIRENRLIYLRQTPPAAQAQLVVRDGLHGVERVLFDPAAAAGSGPQPAIGDVWASPDGSSIAYTTQLGGSEDETIHVVGVDGSQHADTIAHAGGGTSPVALTWDGDGRGFLHTAWPKDDQGRYATAGIVIVHHVLGADPATDTYVFGKGLSPKAEYSLATSRDGALTAAVVADGDGVHAAVYMRRGSDPFHMVAAQGDGIGDSADPGGAFVGDAFYAISHKRDSRGEIVALRPEASFADSKVVVAASAAVIARVVAVANGFITSDIDGGDGSARVFGADGTFRSTIPLPKISTINELAGDPNGGLTVVGYENYTTPTTWLRFDAATGTVHATGIAEHAAGNFSAIVAERVLVPSSDGRVRIPLEIVHARQLRRDGSAPTILTAYGAYGSISKPRFSPTLLAWFERGGVRAQAMIRGGGEYGEAWHQAARLATKTVSSDDVASCAIWLGKHGYATSRHLGILGGSAGGFLMGLALTRNPQLYRAVLSQVGIYDLLRVELTPNGAYNTPEFGTVQDPAQFPWMLRQSPYHNVRKGTAYPAVLMTTGENDPRVEPYMSRKMVAVLQADSDSGLPVLLIQRAGQGHGVGNSFDQGVAEAVDRYVFLDSELR